jgi:hypothetical protein
MSFAEFLPDRHGLGVFFLVSVVLGGGTAWLAGRAIAATWRPWWHVLLYMVLLGAVVRFMHYALFGSNLLSLHSFLVDFGACAAFGLIGFRLTRVNQMIARYAWLNERAGLFRWRRRDHRATRDTSESG